LPNLSSKDSGPALVENSAPLVLSSSPGQDDGKLLDASIELGQGELKASGDRLGEEPCFSAENVRYRK